MNPLNAIKVKLDFSCKYQRVNNGSDNSYLLFSYGRWLQKNNQLKQDLNTNAEIERLYRIAAEHENAKAIINLLNGSLRGYFILNNEDKLSFSQTLIDEGIGAGYYFIALYLHNGAAGLKQDYEMGLRYMRKAADEGSPQAQAYVANILAPLNMAPSVSRKLRRCAAEQGEGDAANALGINYQISNEFHNAIEMFQLGVAAGDSSSASYLSGGFNGADKNNDLYYLGLKEDKERAQRYNDIKKFLSRYSYANPKVPEINEIVPLPPAPLPAWDGKLKWLEEREANIPPEKPSEALIIQMARDKQLDPATGKPLPESPHFVRDDSIKLSCRNGEVCPVSGYWEMEWWDYNSLNTQRIVRFNQGDILPTDRVRRVVTRPWPFEDKIVIEEKMMAWRLIAEV
ncbi:DUF6396 domain-containing protein [Enterobacter sp. CFBP8995]|nr:DUF6396 domain-containing protein [Enterobacter sp. CFBP8995]